jgi:hypothetical protein
MLSEHDQQADPRSQEMIEARLQPRRYTVTLSWEDPGFGDQTITSTREFAVVCPPEDVEERAEQLLNHYGAFDYEIVEL